ncbi:MAG: lycopene cyclase domain-containing protein [Betaproteobacteria bacterium]
MTFHYVWLLWSSAFLLPWVGLWLWAGPYRSTMWRASLATAPFGLTEPLFVPEYWNPPSLFELAQRTGFDIESLIFCFALGGVGAVLYNVVARRSLAPLPSAEHVDVRHRWHRVALLLPFVVFLLLYWLPWNPIYPAIAAMALGVIAGAVCRPDLATETLIGGLLFFFYYAVFMLALLWSAPGYIEQVWNLAALSGILVAGIPLEELVYGFAFGMYWSGVYEHITWRGTPRYGAAVPQSLTAAR